MRRQMRHELQVEIERLRRDALKQGEDVAPLICCHKVVGILHTGRNAGMFNQATQP